MARQPIALRIPVRSRDVGLFPGAIEERQRPVIEDAEKVLERVVARANALGDVQAVRKRENSLRAREAEEVHRQARRRGSGIERLELARWKCDAGARRQADRLLARVGELADAGARRLQPLE